MNCKLNLPESWKLVYYLTKFIGLAPFTIKDDRFHPPGLLDLLCPVLVATSYFLLISKSFIDSLTKFAPGNSPLLLKIWIAALYLISPLTIFFIPIIFLCKHKKIVCLMNMLLISNNELESLGMKVDHGKFFKNLFLTLVMANSAFIASFVVIYLTELNWNIFGLMKYWVDSWFSLNTAFIFSQVLIYIKQRFVLVNQRLNDLLIPFHAAEFPRQLRIFVASRNDRAENQRGIDSLTDVQRIQKIGALHLELCDLLNRTTDIFSTLILSSGFRLFSEIFLGPYWVYFVLQNSSHFRIITVISAAVKMIIAIGNVLIVVYPSVTTCEQGNATKTILCEVWTKFWPMELRNEFIMFSILLFHTPATISPFGVMDLDYLFVFKMFCAAVSYLVIITQLGI